MMYLSTITAAILLLGGVSTSTNTEEITFESHGLTIKGIHLKSGNEKAPLLLVFHQGGASIEGEYEGYIFPRLLEAGYDILGIDIPGGGNRFGGTNKTIKANPPLGQITYCETYQYVESALSYAGEAYDQDIIVWGSSFTGSHVVHLAADHPGEINAVLAFSPAGGGPMADCSAQLFLDGYTIPTIVFRPESEMASPTSQEQARLLQERGAEFHVVEGAVHASSMLNPERENQNVEPVWGFVLDFLERQAK